MPAILLLQCLDLAIQFTRFPALLLIVHQAIGAEYRVVSHHAKQNADPRRRQLVP